MIVPLNPLSKEYKQHLESVFQEAEVNPSPANKTRLQMLYGQLADGLYLHELDSYDRRLIKIMNTVVVDSKED